MEQKKISEYQILKEQTEKENEYFLEDLSVFGLDELNPTYDVDRYLDILKIIRIMSRNKRSVDMVKHMLSVIFVVSDADQLKDDPIKQLDCIAQKFKLATDLALTLKIKV